MTACGTKVACSLDADALERRRDELRAGLLTRVVESRPLDIPPAQDDDAADARDGIALAFAAGDEMQRELDELVDFESRCCGFATYTIRPEPERSLLWVEIVGPRGTRALFERLATAPTESARSRRFGLAGKAGAAGVGSAVLALALCATPALPLVLGAAGLGASFGAVAGWIDTLAPPLLAGGALLVAWTVISRRRTQPR